MNVCELSASADIELYFYGELDSVDRSRVQLHVRSCESCRQRLEDLHAIRRALASRPAVDSPPAGDWSGFMRRLDASLAQPSDASTLRTPEPANQNLRTSEPWNPRTLLALAAMLAVVTIGVILAARFRPVPSAVEGPVPSRVERSAPVTQVAVTAPAAGRPAPNADPRPDRVLREGSAEHLERSKLVVLGLATRDPHARAADWEYERTLAGTLLQDTRLYRQAALQGGAADVERVMRDLETVLLEASMSDEHDRAALQRVQRLITKRDLVVKMQVVAAAGPSGN
jgi:putative zinc finger protein